MLRPGVQLADVYRATATRMWDQGFETYGRGHFGHGVGASIWSEEWPFISATSEAVLESGMVLAFETPWYIDGLGGFIIEDQVLITDSGCEVMAPLSRDLLQIS
jgi:Xaa-Pro aminopeptidase